MISQNVGQDSDRRNREWTTSAPCVLLHYADLSDQAHGPAIDKIVAKQIEAHLVPALDTLLLTPAPYARFVTSVKGAFAKMKEQADAHNPAFGALQESFARYKYTDEEIAEKGVKVVLAEFNQWVHMPDEDAPFFLNAFQHGLVRTWIRISTIMAVRGLSPALAAKVTVAGLEGLALKPASAFLSPARKYTRRVLWKNEKVNFSGTLWTRDVWVDITSASFLKSAVLSAAVALIVDPKQKEQVSAELAKEALASALRYCDRLSKEIHRDTRSNISELVAPGKLLEMQTLLAGDDDSRKKAEAEIRDLADLRLKEARDELANVLGVPSKLLVQDE